MIDSIKQDIVNQILNDSQLNIKYHLVNIKWLNNKVISIETWDFIYNIDIEKRSINIKNKNNISLNNNYNENLPVSLQLDLLINKYLKSINE